MVKACGIALFCGGLTGALILQTWWTTPVFMGFGLGLYVGTELTEREHKRIEAAAKRCSTV